MKKVKFEGREVKAYRGYEAEDFGQWLVNKLHGRIPREDWLYQQEIDYERLLNLAGRYYYTVLLDKKPVNGNLISMGHRFSAYEIVVEEKLRGKEVDTKAIAFVKK